MPKLPEPSDEEKDLFKQDPEWLEPHTYSSDPLPEPNTRHVGIWMIVFAWLAAILVLAFLFDSWLTKHYDPNHVEQKIMTIDGISHTVITRSPYNQYKALGQINQYPVTFLLDTGATDVVLSDTLAKKLKLKKGYKGYATTAGGQVAVYRTRIKELVIGHIRIINIPATINPAMSGDEVLLGMSALQHVSFTQRGDQLILFVEPE